MNEKPSAALVKRLAAYSATAGITLAYTTSVDAQTVYTDIEPDLVLIDFHNHQDSYVFDFDGDGAEDIEFFVCQSTRCPRLSLRYEWHLAAFMMPEGADTRNGVLGYDGLRYYYFGIASRLTSGSIVGPVDASRGFYTYAKAAYYGGYPPYASKYPFINDEGYAGFRFIAGDGQAHYGWVRLAVEFDDFAMEGTLFEYAYEAAPDTPIVAGDRGVLLNGAVDQTVFPPEGGTFRYTFIARNTSGAPLPLDLWVDARRGTGAGRTRLLGSGTLPAGAIVTRTVRVSVPAGAPAGDYDVTFFLGDFDAERVLASESFMVTKEGPAPAIGGEDLFAGTPFPGDLFAEAEVTVRGTHALSAPSPNPSDGKSQLTLTVAETQAVTVAVHDALGRRVALLHEGTLGVGTEHHLTFNGSGLPAGVYVVRAVGENFSDMRVLTLTR